MHMQATSDRDYLGGLDNKRALTRGDTLFGIPNVFFRVVLQLFIARIKIFLTKGSLVDEG